MGTSHNPRKGRLNTLNLLTLGHCILLLQQSEILLWWRHREKETQMFKANDKVIYLNIRKATVLRVQKNGIVIGYWFCKFNVENWMERRVARQDIRPAVTA
jgi:hypothetical protein